MKKLSKLRKKKILSVTNLILLLCLIVFTGISVFFISKKSFDSRSEASYKSTLSLDKVIVSHPQYISVRKSYTAKKGNSTNYPVNVSNPATISPEVWNEIINAVGYGGSENKKLAVTYMVFGIDSNINNDIESIREIFLQAKKNNSPFVINLMIFTWWNNSPDLWNYWNQNYAGYNPNNINNVEWTSTSSLDAVKIAWRNWGKEITIAPQPNLASSQYREAIASRLNQYMTVIESEYKKLTPEEKYLFAGLDIGNEFSIGPNFYHYKGSHQYDYISYKNGLPNSLDIEQGCHGFKSPFNKNCQLDDLGYKAALDMNLISADDTELSMDIKNKIVIDYTNFLGAIISKYYSIPLHKVYAHAVSWDAKSSMDNTTTTGIVDYISPGWSFYEDEAFDPIILDSILTGEREKTPWATTEWFPKANNLKEWKKALTNTLQYKNNKLINIANWEKIYQVGNNYKKNFILKAIKDSLQKESTRKECFLTPTILLGISEYEDGTALKLSSNSSETVTRIIASSKSIISPDGKLSDNDFFDKEVNQKQLVFIDNKFSKQSILMQKYYIQLITIGCNNTKKEYSEIYEVDVKPHKALKSGPLLFISNHGDRVYFSWIFDYYQNDMPQALYLIVSDTNKTDQLGQLENINIINERVSNLTSFTRKLEVGKYYGQIVHDANGERYISPMITFTIK